MTKPYRMMCGLWVFPDFSEVEAGRSAPPQVNHDKIEFAALAKLLGEVFCYGPPVILGVVNDTIDQVTVHSRLGLVQVPTRGTGDPQCGDFGQAALNVAPARLEHNSVIDVREAWRSLHYLQDRSFAPPPTIIPFFVQSSDFEDAMIWFGQSQMVIGVDMLENLLSDLPVTDDDRVGALPKELQSGLADIFGCPFEERCLISRLAEDALPNYAMATP